MGSSFSVISIHFCETVIYRMYKAYGFLRLTNVSSGSVFPCLANYLGVGYVVLAD